MTDKHEFIATVIEETGRKGWDWSASDSQWRRFIRDGRNAEWFTPATAADVLAMELWREVKAAKPGTVVSVGVDGHACARVVVGAYVCYGDTPLAAMHAAWMDVCKVKESSVDPVDKWLLNGGALDEVIESLRGRIAALEKK